MRRAVLALSVLLLALSVDSSAERVAAMTFSMPTAASSHDGRLQAVGFDCKCADCRCTQAWGPRHYWQWDHRPIWDDPWLVLRPTIWGSPEPHLVPAEIWACKWHLPSAHSWPRPWRWHRRQCPTWH